MLTDQFHNEPGYSLQANERLLLQKVSEGDWDTYTGLFNYYLPKLSQYIYPFANQSREDTEEIIQEVFLKIWEKRETLLSIKSLDHYLFRMAKNKLIDLLDRKKSAKKLCAKYSGMFQSFHSEPEQSVLYSEYHAIALKAIEQLSPKLKSVFLLSTQEELPQDKIAEKLGLSKETVKKRLYLARNFIKNYLRTNADWFAFLCYCLFFS